MSADVDRQILCIHERLAHHRRRSSRRRVPRRGKYGAQPSSVVVSPNTRRCLVHEAASGDDVFIRFDGGRNKGTYGQITRSLAGSEREVGHWAAAGRNLRLLGMASDRSNHPRFGVDTPYEIRYSGPDQIALNGPDRPTFVLHRAPEATIVPTFEQP